MGLTDKHLAYGDDIPQTQAEKDYYWKIKHLEEQNNKLKKAYDIAIEALEKEPCEDCISRQAVLELMGNYDLSMGEVVKAIHALPPVTPKEKIGLCKDCKWWKDNDGVYRRGIGAESECPINCKEVYDGNGYCFMFE